MEHINLNIDFTFSINHAHIQSNGEDADPILMCSKDQKNGIVGVFDGMGGAGSTKRKVHNVDYTDAYIASRITRESVIATIKNGGFNDQSLYDFKAPIVATLNDTAEELQVTPSRMKSSMVKVLPTTMSVATWNNSENGILINNYWAGDSRNYIQTVRGLQVLTKDHVRGGGDALFNLHNDPPMSNCVSQSSDFYIESKPIIIKEPVLLFSCTDGCFNYLDSPMHFEHMLLSTLEVSNDVDEWREKMEEYLTIISGDDFSLSIVSFGLSFNYWKKLLYGRYIDLYNRYILPFTTADDKEKEALWNDYKKDFEINIKENEEK